MTTDTTTASPTTWTPERLVYGIVTADDPDINPDGSRIVYSLSTPNQATGKVTSHLWLCGIDGSDARQITQSGARNGGARWSPDGAQVAFVSDRVEKAGIFLLPLGAGSGGDARELTRHAQGISDLAWSPDGSQIAYLTSYDPANPDEQKRDSDLAPQVRSTRRIDYKQDGRGYLGDVRQHVWLLDVASGERRRLTSELVDHTAPQWSPDGSRIGTAIPRFNGMCSQLAVIDVASGEQILVGPETGTFGSWSWSPSGDRILYTGDLSQTFQDDLWVYDLASGESRRLTDDLQVAPADGTAPVWLDDRQVLISAVRAGGSGLHVVDSEQGTIEPVATFQASLGGLKVDTARRYAVSTHSSITTHGELWVQDLQSNTGQVITHLNDAAFAEAPSGIWERFTIQRGKYEIESWILKPANFDPNTTYPVILDIHGGPNGNFSYSYQPLHQLLATNGYVVVFSNPRGSTSYGREFTQQVGLDWGGEDYQDLMAVMDHVLENAWADSSRTGVTGYSYGGYMTSWIIGQTQRFGAAVCGAPAVDLESMYGTSDISHHFGELQWGGSPAQNYDWMAQHSPITHAHKATTPTLIIHGEADERCPIGQAEQLFVALVKAGCEVEFTRYPGGAHSFRRMGHPEHRRDLWERTLGWFNDHIGPGTGV